MAGGNWDERYTRGDAPWDTGRPDPHLVDLVDSGVIRPGSTLEVGCGTGTNTIWLASRGFDVLGVDVSSVAVDQARSKLADGTGGATGRASFRALDFLSEDAGDGPFELVFDRGCFHSFDHADERSQFVHRVARVLDKGGLWVSIIGSTEGPDRDHGPPRRTARDVAAAVEPHLEIRELRSTHLDAELPSSPAAWLLVARPRLVPAQPSTVRPA